MGEGEEGGINAILDNPSTYSAIPPSQIFLLFSDGFIHQRGGFLLREKFKNNMAPSQMVKTFKLF